MDSLQKVAVSFHVGGIVMIGVVGTIANLLTIIAICKYKHLRIPGNFFLLNLALADLIVCTVTNPFTVVSLVNRDWPLSNSLCFFLGAALTLSCSASTTNLVSIAINRYMSILWPQKSQDIFTVKRTLLFCLTGWLVSFITIIPPFFGFGKFGYNDVILACNISNDGNWLYTLVVLGTYFNISTIIIIFCYTKIFMFIRRSRVRTQSDLGRSIQAAQRRVSREIRVAKNLLVVYVAYSICWGPILLLTAVDINQSAPPSIWRFASFLAVLNSSVNPFIYAWKNNKFRNAYKDLLRCGTKPSKPLDSSTFREHSNSGNLTLGKTSSTLQSSKNSPKTSPSGSSTLPRNVP
ncbi:melatonin receptor type 1C-like [Antedon mediterranea]|uniref:melatonin receptor type 1C-like n=1 Tax=Antedon mediterranea TaxID=105859 RepID=UPI003AF7A1C3